jgi:hypothetical protein
MTGLHVRQLSSEYGDKFTASEASHGANQTDAC